MFSNIPVILADHSPWHTIVQLATSPLGLFVVIGVVGLVGFSLVRRNKK